VIYQYELVASDLGDNIFNLLILFCGSVTSVPV